MAKARGSSNKAGIFGRIFDRYFVKAMSFMAQGLFASLIIGLIISQLAKIPYLGFLSSIGAHLGASSPVIGAAIGAAIAYGFQCKGLVVFSSIAAGAIGYAAGGPLGAYLAGVVGAEIGNLVAGRTKLDIVVTPFVTIVSGGFVGILVGPYFQSFMSWLGTVIGNATEMNPFIMGITVAVLVGLALTAPISSAALCISLWGSVNMTSGMLLAAGAAAVGCSAQMIGFAVASRKDNSVGGFLSQALGTSMLQIGNIMKHPQILIAPTLAGAILGPVSTCLLKMTNTATGAGMGTSGLVGQFGAFAAMSASTNNWIVLAEIVIMHIVAPAALTLLIDGALRKAGWIKPGYMCIEK
ncbi:MAG: PTS sugar transporter subunit IIC [Clostridia bacterium]|nr:PTS sugar transporter subunit IIC [Clostridia bacterium]